MHHKFTGTSLSLTAGTPFAWRTDEEFGREMLAGVNPVLISRLQVFDQFETNLSNRYLICHFDSKCRTLSCCNLQEFPPTSKLDPRLYGNHNSTINASHIAKNLEGVTVEQADTDIPLLIISVATVLATMHVHKLKSLFLRC